MPETLFVDVGTGLKLAVDQTGDPDGVPILFFHGWPASRLQGSGFGPEAHELGARIICPDRPGVGLSSLQPGRRLLDWPPLVAELARQLHIDRLRILAISGGGHYAFACAYALPELVEAIAVVSGAPPLGPDVDRRALLAIYRWLLAVYRRQPILVRSFFRVARPFATLQPPRWAWPIILRCVPSADRDALKDLTVFEGSFACYREAWRGSASGVVSDAEVYAQPWGFPVEEVRLPVRLWHGKADRSFSWKLAEELANRLPCCSARFIEDEGHYSLPIRRRREILEDLLTFPTTRAANGQSLSRP